MSGILDFSVLLEEEDEEDEEYIPVEEEEDDDEDEDDEVAVAELPEQAEVGDLNDLIASRTRSKYQIEKVAGDTLQLPDVEPDLYDLSENDDIEWSGFCASLFADDPVADADDDDENDPEYLAGDEDVHFHDKKDSNIVIPAEEADSLLDDDVPTASLASPIHNVNEWSSCFTPDHLNQLKDQFALYLQLLSQQYLLCRERSTLLADSFGCVGKVAEIAELSESCDVADVENLPSVITLIRDNPIRPVKGKYECFHWRKCSISPPIKQIIVQNPSVFICEQLIPHNGYYDVSNKRSDKVVFSPAEDDLIILGLRNFQRHENPVVRRRYVKFICDLILPCKTESSIKARIKNCRRRPDPSNRLSVFLNSGTVSPCVPIAVKRVKTAHNAEDCPHWMKSLLSHSSPTPDRIQAAPVKYKFLLPSKLRPGSDPFQKAHSIVRKYKLIVSRLANKTPQAPHQYPPETCAESAGATEQSAAAAPCLPEEIAERDTRKSGDEDEDDENELAALMAASSTPVTISSNNRVKLKKGTTAKQENLNKQKEISRKILSEDWDSHEADQEMRQLTIVENFMQKARDILSQEEDFVQFLKLLSEFHDSRQTGRNEQSLKDVFKNLESFLKNVNGERLMDDLILFLDQKEALECGKMFEYLHWKRLTSFMRKIEIATAIDSQLLLRLFKTLSQLRQNPFAMDKNRIKAAVHKAVNGHPLLMAEFMTLFLDEAVPDHLVRDEQDFDHITIVSDEDNEQNAFETSAPIPLENDSAYGTPDCPCTRCHKSPGDKSKHCHRCCVTVIDNQIHIVGNSGTGKAEPAIVQYSEKSVEKVTEVSAERRESPVSSESACKKQRTCDEWTTEDDAILLQVVQKKLTCTDLIENHVFEDIAKKVNKSFEQVSARFSALMCVIRELPGSPDKSVTS